MVSGAGPLFVANPATAQATDPVVVLRTGDAAPTAGLSFDQFTTPRLADNGKLFFRATLTGPGVNTNNSLVAVTADANPSAANPFLVAREGDAVPGRPGLVLGTLNDGPIHDTGGVVFLAEYRSAATGSNEGFGMLTGPPNTLSVIAEQGQEEQAGSGATFQGFSRPRFNGAGDVAFRATLAGNVGTFTDEGLYRSPAGGAVQRVFRGGDPSPSVPGAISIVPQRPSLDATGNLAYRIIDSGGSVTPANNTVIYRGGPGSLTEVVRESDAAPLAGYTFSSFSEVYAIDNGATIFSGFVADPGQPSLNGIFIDDPNAGLGLIAIDDGPAPSGPGVTIDTVFSRFAVNANGQALFEARLNDPAVAGNDRATFLYDGTGLQQLFRTGDPVPGGGPGVIDLKLIDSALNDAGQSASTVVLTGAGVSTSNDRALLAADADGTLHTVAREGMPFDGGTLESFAFGGGLDPVEGLYVGNEYAGFNNAGQLAFAYTLTNGNTGVATWSLPSTGTPINGDYNDSGQVEQGDLDLVLQNWGQPFTVLPASWTHQRPTSGIVDQFELDGVLQNWGNSAAPPNLRGLSVPEPASLAIASLAILCLSPRRPTHH